METLKEDQSSVDNYTKSQRNSQLSTKLTLKSQLLQYSQRGINKSKAIEWPLACLEQNTRISIFSKILTLLLLSKYKDQLPHSLKETIIAWSYWLLLNLWNKKYRILIWKAITTVLSFFIKSILSILQRSVNVLKYKKMHFFYWILRKLYKEHSSIH